MQVGRADRISQLCAADPQFPDDDFQRVHAPHPFPDLCHPDRRRYWTNRRTSRTKRLLLPARRWRPGGVDFEHVFFKYADTAEEYVLSDITLHIGAGADDRDRRRHRFCQNLPGSAHPPPVRRDEGHAVASTVGMSGTIRLAHLRDAVGMVLQKNTLFSGTIRENLLWGNEHAGRPGAGMGLPDRLCRRIYPPTSRRVRRPIWVRGASTCPAGRSSACALPGPC